LLNYKHLRTALDRLGLHFLLRVGLKISGALSLCTHALNCVHYVRLLREECVSQVRRPLDIASHPLNDVRKCYQCLDARIPRLLGHCVRQGFVLQVLVIRVPLLKLDHFQRVGGSG
jgi:hypothetical protein